MCPVVGLADLGHIEQLSIWHGVPVATRANGLDGYDAELVFNGPLQVRHLQNLVALMRAGVFEYNDRVNRGESRFVSGDCAIFLTSSSLYGKVASAARFDWTVVPMPFYPDVAAEPRNAILGGGSLYVMQGKSPYEYRGVARFLAFLMEAPQQATLYRNTGYIPTTRAAYAEAVADGFYARHPQLHVAVEELIRRPPTRDTAGLRLGNMLQIRDLWSEEFEAALNGTKSPQQALDDAVSRGKPSAAPLPAADAEIAETAHQGDARNLTASNRWRPSGSIVKPVMSLRRAKCTCVWASGTQGIASRTSPCAFR